MPDTENSEMQAKSQQPREKWMNGHISAYYIYINKLAEEDSGIVLAQDAEILKTYSQ